MTRTRGWLHYGEGKRTDINVEGDNGRAREEDAGVKERDFRKWDEEERK